MLHSPLFSYSNTVEEVIESHCGRKLTGPMKLSEYIVSTKDLLGALGGRAGFARDYVAQSTEHGGGYRTRIGSRLLYRNPVYLLCTYPELPIDRLLQSYLWRWEVELSFRDEKTILGVGEAQVRIREAVETVPAFIVAAYAFLLLAGTEDRKKVFVLPPPKWRTADPPARDSTARLLGMFRSQLWGKAMGVNLSHFIDNRPVGTKPVLFEKILQSAVCYAFR